MPLAPHLKEDYLKENALVRIEGALGSRPALAHLIGRKRVAVNVGRALNVN